jgi:hypothetical protein|tara:strand:- start:269 stop:463 length:195 start_codon:yes stop_codon:yes gene_type:complete
LRNQRVPKLIAQAVVVRSISWLAIGVLSALADLNAGVATTDTSILSETLTIALLVNRVNLGAVE